LNIDPLKDLIPVIQLARQPVVLAVHPALGVNSLASNWSRLQNNGPG
jgi:hypothetical protein